MKREYAAPSADTQTFETEDVIMMSGEFDLNRPVTAEQIKDTKEQ